MAFSSGAGLMMLPYGQASDLIHDWECFGSGSPAHFSFAPQRLGTCGVTIVIPTDNLPEHK
jgi:hypothetical protein